MPQRHHTGDRGSYGRAWRQLRAAVLARDAYQCRIQGPRCLGHADTVDHIVPRHLGGKDVPSNLRAACHPCNYGRRDYTTTLATPAGQLFADAPAPTSTSAVSKIHKPLTSGFSDGSGGHGDRGSRAFPLPEDIFATTTSVVA